MRKIIGPKETSLMTNLSPSTLWRMEKREEFPRRVNISPNRVGWYEDEVDEWVETRPRGICNREIGGEAA